MKIKIRKINEKNTSILANARLTVGGLPVVATVIDNRPGMGGVVLLALEHNSNLKAILAAKAERFFAAAVLRDMGMAAPPTSATIYLTV
jgi:hypothetical protein